MTTPNDGLDRRNFLSLSAVLTGSIALGDILGNNLAVAKSADYLKLEVDTGAWLMEASQIEQQLAPGEYMELPEPTNAYTQFLDNADEVFRASPKLQMLTINNLTSRVTGIRLDAKRLAACPHLARLHTLNLLGCFLEPDDIRALVSSPHLGNLRKLLIWLDAIGDEGVQALAAGPSLTNLRELSLNGNYVGPTGAKALAASPHLSRLEVLDVMCNPIRDEGARALASSTRFRSLTQLRLVDNGIGPEGASALAGGSHFGRLRELGICHQQIGEAGAAILRKRFGSVVWIDEDLTDEVRAMAEEAPFLQAAIARPDDDAPRLSYAEWLAGHDGARAEYVRLQIERASALDYDARQTEWKTLENNLLAAYGDLWLNSLNLVVPWIRGRERTETINQYFFAQQHSKPLYDFRRGLIEHVQISPRSFVRFGSELFRAAPTIRAARVACHLDPGGWAKRFATCPYLARLTELDLSGVSPEFLMVIARSPHLTQIQTLRINGGELAAEALTELLAPARMPRLTSLALSGFSDEVLAHRSVSGHLSRLECLQLNDGELGQEAAATLFASPWPALRSVDFTNTYLGNGGAEELARSPCLARVRSLNLAGTGLDGEQVAALMASRHLGGLEALALGRNDIGPEGAAALAAAPHLTNLKQLSLAATGLDARGLAAIAESSHLAGLRWFDLGDNALGDEGAVALAASARVGLQNLELNGNGLTEDGAAALAESRVVSSALTISLSNNPLGDAGLAALAQSQHLSRLRALFVSAVEAGTIGAASLAQSRLLPELTVLTMHKNPIGDDGAAAFARSDQREGLRVFGSVVGGIGDSGARAIAESRRLDGLIGLELRGNSLSDDVKDILQRKFGSRVRVDGWQPSMVKPFLT